MAEVHLYVPVLHVPGVDSAYKSDRVTGSWATPKKGIVQNVLTTPPHYHKSALKFH